MDFSLAGKEIRHDVLLEIYLLSLPSLRMFSFFKQRIDSPGWIAIVTLGFLASFCLKLRKTAHHREGYHYE